MQKHVIIIRLYSAFVKLFDVIYVKICKIYTNVNMTVVVFVAVCLFGIHMHLCYVTLIYFHPHIFANRISNSVHPSERVEFMRIIKVHFKLLQNILTKFQNGNIIIMQLKIVTMARVKYEQNRKTNSTIKRKTKRFYF